MQWVDRDALDADRRLVLSYFGLRRTEPLAILWLVDARLGTIVARGTSPLVTQMKLAWWREALARLDSASFEEPLLRLMSRYAPDAAGAELAELAAAWEHLLDPGVLAAEDMDAYARMRGGTLFRVSARLLGSDADAAAEAAGEAWALVDLARHSGKAAETSRAIAEAAKRLDRAPTRWPRTLRILAMLTMIVRRDVARGADRFEAPGAPARMLRMICHRLTGR